MTRHILILRGNLPGLITAYRLIPYGFQITILECPSDRAQGDSGLSLAESTLPRMAWSPAIQRGQGLPLILHGFYHSTWSLLQELALAPPPTLQPVDLEFGTSGDKTVTLPRAEWLSVLHPVIRLAFFRGLTWSDRWQLINFLEKKWEGHFPPDHPSDTLTVESWLISAGQSARALNDIWNPLCRFFLGCDSSQASLGYFLEILTRHWLSPSNGPETFLVSPDMLDHLQQALKRVLMAKSVQFYPSQHITNIQANTNRLQSISLANGECLTADAFISTLPPLDLLNLLPERAPARFSSFSYLAQLQEVAGTAVHVTLHGTLLPPRLILNSGPFDWVISQTVPDTQGPKTIVTGITLNPSSSPAPNNEWLIKTAWPHIQHLFHISSEASSSPYQPPITQSGYTVLPCQAGLRTFRPLPSTPIPNLFLVGPWISTQLPPCLESSVASAYACARALAEFSQGTSH